MHEAAKHILETARKNLGQLPGAESWGHVADLMPWYATAHLALALDQSSENGRHLKMAGVFVNDPMRLQVLRNSGDAEWDNWLQHKCVAAAEEEENFDFAASPEKAAIEDISPTVAMQSVDSRISETLPDAAEQDSFTPEMADEDLPPLKPESTLEEPVNDVSPTIPEEPISLKFSLPDLKSVPEEVADEDLLFEPYHTVDYFASQGIKVDKETPPLPKREKFDQQLKSFTQWLRTMKPIHYESPDIPTDPEVEAQANASLQTKVVETEAMAEVLVKQGKLAQAAEIYRKLMLLHPEKSAFFAARLEELKA